jgi:putative ABC transport system permease protein
MALPLSYNLRNLVARKTSTIMTTLGIALTVAVLITVLALMSGLRAALSSTGNPRNVIVMRKGATAEMTSSISRQALQDLLFTPGIARDASGQHPVASPEIVTVVSIGGDGLQKGTNINLRGLLTENVSLHEVHLVEGRWFSAGQREVVLGKAVAKRHPDAHVGTHLRFGPNDWEVVGVMDGGRSASNSEVFADLNQVASGFNRQDLLNSVLLRAESDTAVPRLAATLNQDRRLNVVAESERSYYAAQTVSGAPLQFLGTFISIIMALGSAFAAMNTMYASVSRRSAEIGTLRVLGFSKEAILWSFLFESVLLACVGGVLACVATLPLNGVTTGIGNLMTFTETAFQFQVGLQVVSYGMLFALLIGAIGGLLPARAAANKEILTALRQT